MKMTIIPLPAIKYHRLTDDFQDSHEALLRRDRHSKVNKRGLKKTNKCFGENARKGRMSGKTENYCTSRLKVFERMTEDAHFV